jgi:5-methyltetrahydropteroyltriglutamate--homocysteine methyltransferase
MSDIPADMTITMHLCRGNYKSTFMGAGGYEPVQEILFNKINVHGYFMEYDDERAGGFEPLRCCRRARGRARHRHHQDRQARIQGRAQAPHRRGGEVRPLDQLCLSPQCGFASTEEGNVLTEDEQWAKLPHRRRSRRRAPSARRARSRAAS